MAAVLVVRIFYGPLYLAVTCSVLVCLRSTCVDFFWETTSGFISVFSASSSDSGYMFLPVYGGALYSDPATDSRPALFITVYSALLGPQWYMLCVSPRNFRFFYVSRWITDPEVDSRLSGHVVRSLVSDSHLFVPSPEEYMISILWEMTSGIISVDTCRCQATRLLKEFHTILHVKYGEDFGLSPYSALRLVRQRIHALCQFTELVKKLTYLYGGFWK